VARAGGSTVRVLWGATAGLLFPESCPGCGATGVALCDRCHRAAPASPRLAPPPGLDALRVPFAYTGAVLELVARAKYRDRHAAWSFLARELAGCLTPEERRVDVVTWAPTTNARRRARGFDQAELLARRLAGEIGRPVRPGLRRLGGAAQTGADRATRELGPRFTPRWCPGRAQAPVSVLLVDDVVTTGSTMRAAAVALRAGGARTVVGGAAARRP
jgi:predicted amidophosphoribosyltransferase